MVSTGPWLGFLFDLLATGAHFGKQDGSQPLAGFSAAQAVVALLDTLATTVGCPGRVDALTSEIDVLWF